ncbi:hypothetical protein NDU88_003317 [Pleurodeles waltl]|uniref:Uncharacterized protein n=1 Tax=Pleurodeles waltl TaxID=8319 RepID=A0AAV7KV88_PLEWA|nr:hypothetical protein NDU88_003317 [Pleurodeles waltl]
MLHRASPAPIRLGLAQLSQSTSGLPPIIGGSVSCSGALVQDLRVANCISGRRYLALSSSLMSRAVPCHRATQDPRHEVHEGHQEFCNSLRSHSG